MLSKNHKCFQPKSLIELTPDLDLLEKRCRSAGHLGASESLSDLIQADLKTINDHGITQEQIRDFFILLNAPTSDQKNSIGSKETLAFLTPEIFVKVNDFITEHFSQVGTSGWCIWNKECRYLEINQKKLVHFKITWGGAEQCPILTNYVSGYFGYVYGSHDHFFVDLETTEVFWVPDLFPLQFYNYGFAQGIESLYRTDPETVINFFGLKPGVDYFPVLGKKEKFKWITSSTTQPKSTDEFKTIYDDDEITVCEMDNGRGKLQYAVWVKNPVDPASCSTSQKPKIIQIDGVDLSCDLSFAFHKYEKIIDCEAYQGHNLDHFEVTLIILK